MEQFLPHADLVVNSSYTEGLPVVVLEALAAGVPVVATAVGGTPEVIDDGVQGFLVPAGDPGALARRIEDALANEERRQRWAKHGRQRVQARVYLPGHGPALSSKSSNRLPAASEVRRDMAEPGGLSRTGSSPAVRFALRPQTERFLDELAGSDLLAVRGLCARHLPGLPARAGSWRPGCGGGRSQRGTVLGPVSIVLAVHNEAANIERRLRELTGLLDTSGLQGRDHRRLRRLDRRHRDAGPGPSPAQGVRLVELAGQ